MISSLQPSRPRVRNPQTTVLSSYLHRTGANYSYQYPPQSISPSLNQQPTRSPSSTSSKPTPIYTPPAPRTQIEAMPPSPLPTSPLQARQVLLDAAKRHPVFFTDRLKKAPLGVNTGGGSWVSPVAMGYVFNDGARRAEGGVKL
jgi:hypothetical protein